MKISLVVLLALACTAASSGECDIEAEKLDILGLLSRSEASSDPAEWVGLSKGVARASEVSRRRYAELGCSHRFS